jgi:hypothetical protein
MQSPSWSKLKFNPQSPGNKKQACYHLSKAATHQHNFIDLSGSFVKS